MEQNQHLKIYGTESTLKIYGTNTFVVKNLKQANKKLLLFIVIRKLRKKS
jgi:hypothetical protein